MIKVSRVPLKSSIAIFAWRVTSNYTIRPFKGGVKWQLDIPVVYLCLVVRPIVQGKMQ